MRMIQCKMGDVVSLEQGLAINKKSKHLIVQSGIPLLRITDMFSRKFNQFIDKDKIPEKFISRDNDLIYSRTGQVGHVFRNQKGVIHNNCFRIDPVDAVDRGYMFWFLKQAKVRGHANNLASGAAQPDLNHDAFKSLDFNYPESINDQKEIAGLLDQYDNLIENNNRRIAILEEMAQSLYREWFVKFRLPGHDQSSGKTIGTAEGCPKGASTKDGVSEGCQFKDSPLGRIPEGWEVKSAAEVIDINPRTSLPKGGVKPFVPMTSLSESSMIIGEIEERAGNSGTKFKNRDTLFARITPCLQNGKIGYVQFLNEENLIGFGSTEFIVLRESILPSEYIYCLARSSNFRSHAINSMAGADGRQRVKSDCFSAYFLAVPPVNLLELYSSMARPCFEEIYNLNKKNKNLKQQHDMLLPKLISGKITVS